MSTNHPKATLITELHLSRNESTCQNVKKLLELLMCETRLDNDTASGEVILRNQGKIVGFLQILEYIERGSPTTQG